MINRKSLKHRIMAIRFAIWDLHLYLNTHCEDTKAKELLEKYMEKYQELLPEYICKYGPINFGDSSSAAWLRSPFPWDNTGSDC